MLVPAFPECIESAAVESIDLPAHAFELPRWGGDAIAPHLHPLYRVSFGDSAHAAVIWANEEIGVVVFHAPERCEGAKLELYAIYPDDVGWLAREMAANGWEIDNILTDDVSFSPSSSGEMSWRLSNSGRGD